MLALADDTVESTDPVGGSKWLPSVKDRRVLHNPQEGGSSLEPSKSRDNTESPESSAALVEET